MRIGEDGMMSCPTFVRLSFSFFLLRRNAKGDFRRELYGGRQVDFFFFFPLSFFYLDLPALAPAAEAAFSTREG